jgi:hypothetical protein
MHVPYQNATVVPSAPPAPTEDDVLLSLSHVYPSLPVPASGHGGFSTNNRNYTELGDEDDDTVSIEVQR